eukprot:g4573.t1
MARRTESTTYFGLPNAADPIARTEARSTERCGSRKGGSRRGRKGCCITDLIVHTGARPPERSGRSKGGAGGRMEWTGLPTARVEGGGGTVLYFCGMQGMTPCIREDP